MAVFTTEGIVLGRSNFGEADRILTVLTPYKGKVKIVAKGVRRVTSRRAGNVEVLNRVKLTLFVGKGMPVLTEADSLQTYPRIKSNLTSSSYGSHLVEIADRLIPQDQVNPQVYQVLVEVLDLMEKNPRQIFVRAYEVKVLAALGFWSVGQVQASSQIKDILSKLQFGSFEEISQLKLTQVQAMELARIMRYYIERTLESPLRSIQVIEKLKDG
ncbi:DNA repair protein RecO [Candidatus Daviesbacteria bacterium]|nr:DNA repair protein RecO [Candidatus Daviesbacteria bacterium]